MTIGEQERFLMTRARQARDRAAMVTAAMKITIDQTRSLSLGGTEALRRSQVAELSELVENLSKRLDSQPVIEQAKGILMAHSYCSADEAFEMLRRASMRMNRKLRDLAREIVESTERGAPSELFPGTGGLSG